MRAAQQAPPDQIDFTDLWRMVCRSLPRLLLFTLIGGGVTYLGLSLVVPRYESEARLTVVANGSSGPKDEIGGPRSVAASMDKLAINTHVSALRSRDLAAKIVADMQLNGKVEFNSALGSPDLLSAALRMAGVGAPRAGESEEDRVLSAYYQRLEVYPAKDNRVIGVRMSSRDPQLAAAVANGLVEAYRAALATRSVSASDELQKAFEPKLEQLRNEVTEVEKAVEKLRGEANLFKTSQQTTGLNEQQLAELTAELTRAKTARSEADARIKAAREMLKSGTADSQPNVRKSAIIQNLAQNRMRIERQISELSATLRPEHPRMRQLRADLASLKKQLAADSAKVLQSVIESLEKEAEVAGLREDSIAKGLEEIKARIVTTGPNEAKLRQLEAEAKSKREELDGLAAQYETRKTAAESRAVPTELQVITKAVASSVPVFPKKMSLATVVMAATFLFGLAIVVTKGVLSGTRRALPSTEEVQRIGPAVPESKVASAPGPQAPSKDSEPVEALAPTLVAMPKAEAPPVSPAAQLAPQTKSANTVFDPLKDLAMFKRSAAATTQPGIKPGSMGELATRILDKAMGPAGFRSLVVGERQVLKAGQEALEYASTLAAAGRSVVLIDWSLRGEGLGGALGLPVTPGIASLLGGQAKFDDIVKTIPGTSVHGIGPGLALEAGLASLDVERVNLVLDALDETYDHIVVMAHYDEACELFEAIEGRFDAGVLVCEGKRRISVVEAQDQTFLGFEVTDIELMRYERPPSMSVPSDRLQKFTQPARSAAGAA